jgi:hypothetical protein
MQNLCRLTYKCGNPVFKTLRLSTQNVLDPGERVVREMLFSKMLLLSDRNIRLSLKSGMLNDTLHETRKYIYERSTWLFFVINL